ncbi:uncharacterized protein LOC135399091 [Ornithodoros turicata]|uniref:uncharacterized protein LOC135399091 n=1 Tax=Ornithodoros turicata TaxID=34597 RepID=UPI003139E790
MPESAAVSQTPSNVGESVAHEQDASKKEHVSQGGSVVPEDSVHITPPRHVPLYYTWCVCCSCFALFIVPVSFTGLAIVNRGKNFSTLPPGVGDGDIPEGEEECTDYGAVDALYMGRTIQHKGTVFCVYNAETYRAKPPGVHYVPMMIPGAYCDHLLYYSATFDGNSGELKSRFLETDFHCGGYESLIKVKERFINLKTHLVVGGAQSRFENLTLAALPLFAKSVQRWLDRYHLDGVFIDWGFPDAGADTTRLFKRLRVILGTEKQIGVILPEEDQYLNEYNVTELVPIVDWMFATTHEYFPRPGYNRTSCPSPLRGNTGTIEGRMQHYFGLLGNYLSEKNFCFSISFRAVLNVLDPPNQRDPQSFIERNETVENMPVPYTTTCTYEPTSKKNTIAMCAYTFPDSTTYLGFETVWSIEEKMKSIIGMLAGQMNIREEDGSYCVAVWRIDMDDITGTCKGLKYPLLDMVVNTLPKAKRQYLYVF